MCRLIYRSIHDDNVVIISLNHGCFEWTDQLNHSLNQPISNKNINTQYFSQHFLYGAPVVVSNNLQLLTRIMSPQCVKQSTYNKNNLINSHTLDQIKKKKIYFYCIEIIFYSLYVVHECGFTQYQRSIKIIIKKNFEKKVWALGTTSTKAGWQLIKFESVYSINKWFSLFATVNGRTHMLAALWARFVFE